MSRARASPSSSTTVAGGSSSHSPSSAARPPLDARVEPPEHGLGHVEPEDHAGLLLLDPRAGAPPGLDDRLGRQVARADVLGERARDQVLDLVVSDQGLGR